MSAQNTTMEIFEKDNLDELARAFDRYWRLYPGIRQSAVAHLAKNFAVHLWLRVRGMSLGKGVITKDRLEAFKRGEGIKISDRVRRSAYNKMGVASMVSKRSMITTTRKSGVAMGGWEIQRILAQKELALRESSRQFTAASVRFKGSFKSRIFSTRGSQQLGMGTPERNTSESDQFVYTWGMEVSKWSALAALGLTKKYRSQFNPALLSTIKDMEGFIHSQESAAAKSAARNIKRMLG